MHSKTCIVDDVWMAIGSDNLNRRSWTHDSEISCGILDQTPDERAPADPGGMGDGARKLPRDTRLRLAVEHTVGAVDRDAMIAPEDWFAALKQSAATLDAWHRDGKRGPRPPGHLRAHVIERVDGTPLALAKWAHTKVVDPDGRPSRLKHNDSF